MQIIINNHDFRYEMENIARMFFHQKELEIKYNEQNPDGDFVLTEICDNEIIVKVCVSGEVSQKREIIKSQNNQQTEWQMAGVLYDLLLSLSGKSQKWGLLTGVRPTRLVHRMLDADASVSEIREKFLNQNLENRNRWNYSCEVSTTIMNQVHYFQYAKGM